KVAIDIANKVFAPAKIKVELIKFETLTKKELTDLAKALNSLNTNEKRIELIVKVAQAASDKNKADIGIAIFPIDLLGIDVRGANIVDPDKAKEKDKIVSVSPGGFVGGILLSDTKMTALTLAQEIRDRLTFEDNKQKGNKLRNGTTSDLIR